MFSLENYHRSLIPTGGRLDLRAGISLIFVFFCGFLGVFLEGKHLTRYILHDSEE